MDTGTTTILLTGLTAVAALGAVYATLKTAQAAISAAEVARMAALLNSVPLLVPWTPEKSGEIEVINRGGSTSHNLRWRVQIGGETLADGSDQMVIPSHRGDRGKQLQLTPEERAKVVSWASDRPSVMSIECIYLASWGQEFKTVRTYPAKNTGSVIVITDEHGIPLRLDPQDI